jgi:hypothetical protein
MPNHTVKAGDCFSSIAKANGFHKYSTLYDHADNAATKALRPNPNLLVAGDTVAVPAKRAKTVPLVLDGSKSLLIERTPTDLCVYVGMLDKAVYGVATARIAVGGKFATALPDGAGKLELKGIDAAAKEGSVSIQIRALVPPVAPVVPAAAVPSPPNHPPPIDETEFTDKPPKLVLDAVTVRWTLKLGALEPHTTVRGVLQRLVNLGLDTPVVTAEDERTQRFVKHFQSFGNPGVAPSGNVADARAAVETLHDHP